MRTLRSAAVGIAIVASSTNAWLLPCRNTRLSFGLSAIRRREVLSDAAIVLGLAGMSAPATADNSVTTAAPVPGLAPYKDPLNLFNVNIPKGWYKVRPTAEGDLPDSDGNGRRGPRIFSAGDVSNPYAPQIMSVERFPMTALFEDVGMGKGASGASAWQDIGKVSFRLAGCVASLLELFSLHWLVIEIFGLSEIFKLAHEIISSTLLQASLRFPSYLFFFPVLLLG